MKNKKAKRKHVKRFQDDHYKEANERIYNCADTAWFIYFCPVPVSLAGFHRKFKRYQLI